MWAIHHDCLQKNTIWKRGEKRVVTLPEKTQTLPQPDDQGQIDSHKLY